MSPDLERQNQIALLAVQAMLGLISTNVIAVAVKSSEHRTTLHFWLHQTDSETAEDIDDILFELEALLVPDSMEVASKTHIGSPMPDWPNSGYRMIYWAKRASAK